MELGVRDTGLSAMIIGYGASAVGLGSGIYTLEEAMLLVIAIATASNSLFKYIEG